MSPEAANCALPILAALKRYQLYALAGQCFSPPPATLAEWQARVAGFSNAGGILNRMSLEESLTLAVADLVATGQLADEAALADLRARYLERFSLLHPGSWPPYETEYTGENNDFFKNQELADLMGFYRAFGVDPARGERPDHIGVELEFLHFLALKEALARETGKEEEAAVCAEAQKKFLHDHLGRWAETFAAALTKLPAEEAFYRAVGGFLAALVGWNCREWGVNPERVAARRPRTPASEPAAGCGNACAANRCCE